MMNSLFSSNDYKCANSDPYEGQGKIWEIAARNNKKQNQVNKKRVKECERVGLL